MTKDNLKSNSPICFLSGGETQVDVKNNSGQGGRNTHFTLLFAKHAIINNLYKKKKITFISFATDGNDGNTDAAGAVVQIDKIVKRTLKGEKVALVQKRRLNKTSLPELRKNTV